MIPFSRLRPSFRRRRTRPKCFLDEHVDAAQRLGDAGHRRREDPQDHQAPGRSRAAGARARVMRRAHRRDWCVAVRLVKLTRTYPVSAWSRTLHMHDRQAGCRQRLVELIAQGAGDDRWRERLAWTQRRVPVDPPHAGFSVGIPRVIHEQLSLSPAVAFFEDQVEPLVESFAGRCAQPVSGHGPFSSGALQAGIRLGQAEDLSLVQLMVEELREIAITLACRPAPRRMPDPRAR